MKAEGHASIWSFRLVLFLTLLLSAGWLAWHSQQQQKFLGMVLVDMLKDDHTPKDCQSSQTQQLDVVVAHNSDFWWQLDFGSHWEVPSCTWQGAPLGCHYVSAAHAPGNTTAERMMRHAAVLVKELCWDSSSIPAHLQHLPTVMFSMESVPNNPCMLTQEATLNMTYKKTSQVRGWRPELEMGRRWCEQLQQHLHVV